MSSGDVTSASLILQARRCGGLTQQQLAERLGIHREHISRWERSGALPSYERLRVVLRACGYELSPQLRVTDRG